MFAHIYEHMTQLTHKMGPMYVLYNKMTESHDDAHVQKNPAILEFWESAKNHPFSCFSE
jgi:hypothetical protein